MPRKAKHLVLLGPFGRQIGEASNAHAVRQGAIDCGFDEIGCEESQRDCHVDFAGAAALAFGNVSAFAVGSVTSSSSQRRPRAIDATNVARFSERIRRTFCGKIPSGRRISRRRVDAAFCQGTCERALASDRFVVLARSPCTSWMINCSA